MKINEQRLLGNLHELRKFTTTPGEGVTRFSYTPMDAKARAYIIKRAEAAGCSVAIDALQNIRIGLGSNVPGRPVVLAGSHIDTVQNGGWLDGIYGVCGALEVMETLTEEVGRGTFVPSCNYEVIIFAEEEGSNFGSTMTGSKFLAGKYGEAELDSLKDGAGNTLRQRLAALADIPDAPECASPLYNRGDVDVSEVPLDFGTIKTMLELHIEQGPVLDREGLSMGIVDNIFGMRVVEFTLSGLGNHAGASPMSERADALCAAAEAITECESIVRSDEDHRTVVTFGHIEMLPNQSNVIPETVHLTMEVRDRDKAKIDEYTQICIDTFRSVCEERGLECSIHEHSSSVPIVLSRRLVGEMTRRAEDHQINFKVMDSGAVHDACMLAEHVDTGMIFAPSINGRSHVPEEDTDEADLVSAAQFLMDTVLEELK